MFNSPERTTNLGHHNDVVPAVKDVPFGSKADVCGAPAHVRFTPESDIKCDIMECPLWATTDIRQPNAKLIAGLCGSFDVCVDFATKHREIDGFGKKCLGAIL
jgi:hypothetical protein